jgi:ArsR family transcriptional regulator, arsenate/arsenite/antimonite-responsive transcriptional repressor
MALSRKGSYDKDDIKLARYAKTMSHPARIAILRHLASAETCFFNELAKELPLANSTVSQHITELKSSGLISGYYEPPGVRYSINTEKWRLARKLLKDFTKIKTVKNENIS